MSAASSERMSEGSAAIAIACPPAVTFSATSASAASACTEYFTPTVARHAAPGRPRALPVTWLHHSIMLPFHRPISVDQSFYRDTGLAGGGTTMEMRTFGRTRMQLSVLGFGCGAVGGLMVRGDSHDQERTI